MPDWYQYFNNSISVSNAQPKWGNTALDGNELVFQKLKGSQ